MQTFLTLFLVVRQETTQTGRPSGTVQVHVDPSPPLLNTSLFAARHSIKHKPKRMPVTGPLIFIWLILLALTRLLSLLLPLITHILSYPISLSQKRTQQIPSSASAHCNGGPRYSRNPLLGDMHARERNPKKMTAEADSPRRPMEKGLGDPR